MQLLNKNFIIKNKKTKNKINSPDKYFRDLFLSEMQISGIYFLINNNKIIYIGKSIDIDARLYRHKKERRINFEYFYFKEYPKNILSKIEAKYIFKFLPK